VDDPDNFCYACFDGKYPVPLRNNHNKSVMEDCQV
jgi:glutamine phosphoribosylpyrophosphate amidotransferase